MISCECRGYGGELITLAVCQSLDGDMLSCYDVTILTDDDAEVTLRSVEPEEIDLEV